MFAFLPVFIIIFIFVFFRERPTALQCLGGILAIVGVIVLSLYSEQSEHGINPAKGNFLACAAGYTILLKNCPVLIFHFFSSCSKLHWYNIFLPFALLDSDLPSEISLRGIMAVLYFGVMFTVGAYTLFNIGMFSISATQGGMYFNLIPIFTLIFSIIVLNERISLG